MTVTTNMTFTSKGNADNRITLSVAESTQSGAYMNSSSNAEIPHNDGITVSHPTISGLQRSGENHILTSGTITVVWTLAENITSQQITNYTTWLASDMPTATITHDSTENTITMVYTAEYGQTSFKSLPVSYSPLRTNAKMTFSTGSDFACFLRTDGSPDSWTVDYRDIAASGSATIDKEGTHCYVFFSEAVTVGSNTRNAYELYKITSSSITASATTACKVIRLYRD